MAYTTLAVVRSILPKVITIGDTNITTPTIQKPAGAVTVSTKDAMRYIQIATEYIDSRLRTLYTIPLKRIKDIETAPLENIKKGTKILRVEDNGRFSVGMWLRISDINGISELHDIKDIPDNDMHNIEIETAVANNYSLSNQPMISLLRFPDPIPSMCAKYAVSIAIDRQFVAEQEPDVSNYGKTLRTQVTLDIDNILLGIIRLDGQEHTGRRFVRLSLFDKFSTTADMQLGAAKET